MPKKSQKPQKSLTILSIVLAVCTSVITSCSSLPHQEVKIRDDKWYGLKGSEGAHWFHSLSDSSGDITKDQWEKIAFGKICTDSKNFASWSATIQKLCDSCNCCSRDPVSDLIAFMSRVKKFRTEAHLRTDLMFDEPRGSKSYWADSP